jgi:hypothetical protein
MYFLIGVLLLTLLLIPRHTFLWRWLIGTLKGLDCTINCMLLFGDYRETISGRLGKAYQRGVKWVVPFYYLINLMFWVVDMDLKHCIKSIDWAVGDLTIIRWE